MKVQHQHLQFRFQIELDTPRILREKNGAKVRHAKCLKINVTTHVGDPSLMVEAYGFQINNDGTVGRRNINLLLMGDEIPADVLKQVNLTIGEMLHEALQKYSSTVSSS